MSDWERFLREVSWFVDHGEAVTVGETTPWSRGPVDGLPELSALLHSADVTHATVGGTHYELFAWGPPTDRRGWLSHPPRRADADPVLQVHKSFWQVCGGIVERFQEPDTWWNNQNEVLTASASELTTGDLLTGYTWLWEDEGLEIPINPAEYYTVAVEANGNLTLAHREDGRLLLFAPDHSFEHVTRLEGAPPYSLYTINDVPDLATWIEVCSAAWRDGRDLGT
ncbi:hypothetical protein FHU36_007946 [Nonomuraea muscovyensis]|uniref:Uncharacterized protein n=1 Tax=Nonomuraea muscovyensis TaxID=1124761 RepID=A0A7X0F0X3_9ACTN|nr:hypothetical protein [Nonomuraea muscovyensis]MBB6351363.1 hypothetical protein [Nonomuraea muscovyensis]